MPLWGFRSPWSSTGASTTRGEKFVNFVPGSKSRRRASMTSLLSRGPQVQHHPRRGRPRTSYARRQVEPIAESVTDRTLHIGTVSGDPERGFKAFDENDR